LNALQREEFEKTPLEKRKKRTHANEFNGTRRGGRKFAKGGSQDHFGQTGVGRVRIRLPKEGNQFGKRRDGEKNQRRGEKKLAKGDNRAKHLVLAGQARGLMQNRKRKQNKKNTTQKSGN